MSSPPDTTQIVLQLAAGDKAAAEKLMPLVYEQLRALAGRSLRNERRDHTLQATALVHEAYMRMVDQTKVDWKGKTHFLAVSAQMIRRVLVDHARKRAAIKRGGGAVTITLDEALAASVSATDLDLVALDEALKELHGLSERQARVVEMRFFGGLTVEETAHALGISERTVKGDWRVAKAWLGQRIRE